MRFFVTEDQLQGEYVRLDPSDAVHIARVLRMRPGEEITVCCTNGQAYSCKLDQVDKREVWAEILSSAPFDSEPTVQTTVYAGLSKGDRFDYLLQKCVECGAARVVPFLSQHCVVRPDPQEGEKKRLRYQRIALEASKQCQRSRVVQVGEIVPLERALSQAAQADCPLFLYEKERQRSLSALLREAKRTSFSIVAGPEGGFSPEEAALAAQMGLHCVSIGPRILRCETAPVAALCAVMYQTGNFDIGE